jgi:hypothetical protein
MAIASIIPNFLMGIIIGAGIQVTSMIHHLSAADTVFRHEMGIR